MSFSRREFERFYTEHLDKVYRFVFFRVGADKALAEDLVSEIFLKALKAFATFDEDKSHSAWIMTIAKNHLANHWRDTRPTSPLPSELDTDPVGGEGLHTNDKWLLASGQKELQKFFLGQELTSVLAKLAPDEQEIVTFHYLYGYSYAEIAEERGATEGATKVMAHRALKKMRQLL